MAATVSPPIRVAHVTTIDLTLRVLLMGQLRRLRDEGFDVTGISAPGPAAEALAGEGIRHIPWPHASRAWDPRADALAFAELVRIFRRERFDLVHAHNPKPGIMARVAGRLAGVPCVAHTSHGLWVTPEDRAAKRLPVLAAEWFAGRFSDLELYQSEEDLDWARRLGLARRGRTFLLGNGTDLTRFDPEAVPSSRLTELRGELGIPEGSLVVGTVGRLVAEKGYREFFAAARAIRAALPGTCFVAVGDRDPEKADAIGEEDLRRARRDVVIAGWRDDVAELLALMDVFVLPSWREGMPRSAIEAAAMGKPLVLTDIRGCREVARHGIEGIIVPPRDPEPLARAIEGLLRDAGARERMGAAARGRALDRFDERRVTQVIVDRYRDVLARKGLAGRLREVA